MTFTSLDAAANVPPPDVVSIESPTDIITDKTEDLEVCTVYWAFWIVEGWDSVLPHTKKMMDSKYN